MSISLMSAAFRSGLPSTQRFVFLALCDCANDNGECYPSIQNLMFKTGLGERTVQGCIVELERLGYVRREMRKGRSTVYWLSIPTPAVAAPPQQMHPRSSCTPPPQQLHPTPAAAAPRTINEPSRNRKRGESADPPAPPAPALTGQAANDDPPDKPAKSKGKPLVTFSTWIASLPSGEKAIPEDDPIFDFAAKARIPDELLALAWEWFRREHTEARKDKRYRDWRQAFRNSVRNNWGKLWFFAPDGECRQASAGTAMRNVLAAEAERAAA